MRKQEQRKRSQCWNGPSCYYLGKNNCRFFHPPWHYSNEKARCHQPNNLFCGHAQFQQMLLQKNYYEYSKRMPMYQQQQQHLDHQLNSASQNPNLSFPFCQFPLMPQDQSYTEFNSNSNSNFNWLGYNNHIDFIQNSNSDQNIITRRNIMDVLMNRDNFDSNSSKQFSPSIFSALDIDENVTDTENEEDIPLDQDGNSFDDEQSFAYEQGDDDDDDVYDDDAFNWFFQKNNIFYEQDITAKQLDRYNQCPICFQHFQAQQTVKQKQCNPNEEESLQKLSEYFVRKEQQNLQQKIEYKQTKLNNLEVSSRINGANHKIQTLNQSDNSNDYYSQTQIEQKLSAMIKGYYFIDRFLNNDFIQKINQTQQQRNQKQIQKWQQDNMKLFQKLREQEDRRKLLQLYCGHIYHTDCIQFWLKKNPCCAVCRKDFRNHVNYQKWDKNYKLRYSQSQSDSQSQFQDSQFFIQPPNFPQSMQIHISIDNPRISSRQFDDGNSYILDNMNQIQQQRYFNQFKMGIISLQQLYQKMGLKRLQQNFVYNNQKIQGENGDILRGQMNLQQQSDYGKYLIDIVYEQQESKKRHETNHDKNHDKNPEENSEQEKDKCQQQEKDQCQEWIDLLMIDS